MLYVFNTILRPVPLLFWKMHVFILTLIYINSSKELRQTHHCSISTWIRVIRKWIQKSTLPILEMVVCQIRDVLVRWWTLCSVHWARFRSKCELQGLLLWYFPMNNRLCCLQNYRIHSLYGLSVCYTFWPSLFLGKSQNQAFQFQDEIWFLLDFNKKLTIWVGASSKLWMENDEILFTVLCKCIKLTKIKL